MFTYLLRPHTGLEAEETNDNCYYCELCCVLTDVRDNNVDECDLDLYFSTDFEILGKIEHHELKSGGDDVRVTESNKLEYIRSAQSLLSE